MSLRRLAKVLLFVAGACVLVSGVPAQTPSTARRVVIAASMALDGRGGVLRDTRIVIEGSKIVALDPRAEPVDYDLRGLTVLPGWIDAHVHLNWLFGKDGKFGTGGWTPEESAAQIAANARGAEALGMSDEIGAIAPGFEADIIALDGNPLEDITAVRRVVFVMKGGAVHKNTPRRAPR